MKLSTKLPAFTLFELILGMLLSAIVIGMIYSAWFLFDQVYRNYMNTSAAQSEIVTFRRTFSTDLDKATFLRISENEILLLDSLNEEQLRYEVFADGVVRKGSVLDTFNLSQLIFRSSFEREEVSDGLVDEFAFSLVFKERPVAFSVGKYYSSADLFKAR